MLLHTIKQRELCSIFYLCRSLSSKRISAGILVFLQMLIYLCIWIVLSHQSNYLFELYLYCMVESTYTFFFVHDPLGGIAGRNNTMETHYGVLYHIFVSILFTLTARGFTFNVKIYTLREKDWVESV